jgi:hypothetical protein
MRSHKQGIFQLLIAIFILVLFLSLLKVDIRRLFTSEITQQNFNYVLELLHEGWEYLKALFIAVVWEPLKSIFN